MVWTMWQGWHDEKQKNVHLEREFERLTTTLHRVVDERNNLKIKCDKLREERDKLEEENKKLRKS
jgi:predicted  nucleic acid-binding Zn-ribbon protein